MKKIFLLLITVIVALSLVGCANVSDNAQSGNQDELFSPYNEIGKVSSKAVKEINKDMTYEEIIRKLGKTKDVGSGLHVAHYIVDDQLDLFISFAALDDKYPLTGEDLLKQAKPISNIK